MNSRTTLAAIFAGLTLSGCGPVNSKPAETSSKTSSVDSSKGVVVFSQNQQYVIEAKLDTGDDPSAKPQLGYNQYIIRVVNGSDLSPAPKDLQLAVTFSHDNSKVPRDYPATTEPQADGTYLVVVQTKKHGEWTLHLQISDPSKAGDTGDAAATTDRDAKQSAVTDKADIALKI